MRLAGGSLLASAILLLSQVDFSKGEHGLPPDHNECAFQEPEFGANAKDEQLKKFTISEEGTLETTNFGVLVNNSDSLKVGYRGPALMEDFMLREKIMHFGKLNVTIVLV